MDVEYCKQMRDRKRAHSCTHLTKNLYAAWCKSDTKITRVDSNRDNCSSLADMDERWRISKWNKIITQSQHKIFANAEFKVKISEAMCQKLNAFFAIIVPRRCMHINNDVQHYECCAKDTIGKSKSKNKRKRMIHTNLAVFSRHNHLQSKRK